jgi:hypothetical protein
VVKTLDLQHVLCRVSLHDRLYLAPLKEADLKYALDFGTGTGIWAIEFGSFSACLTVRLDLTQESATASQYSSNRK